MYGIICSKAPLSFQTLDSVIVMLLVTYLDSILQTAIEQYSEMSQDWLLELL